MNDTSLTPHGLERRLKRHLLKEPQQFLAITTPGFEHLLERELVHLGITVTSKTTGGVEFCGPLDLVYLTNLHLRTANRILMRISSFTARSYPELYNKCGRISWELYTGFNDEISFSVSSRNSRLHHSEHISDAVFGAIRDYMNRSGIALSQSKESALRFHVRFADDICTVSIDTSGELLYKRGYRIETGIAPIRETTASALLMESQWDRYSVVADPLCGSGTFMLEAILMAINRAPGINRKFAFLSWPSFNDQRYERFRREAVAREKTDISVRFIASDISENAVSAARENTKRLGISDLLILRQQDCLNFDCGIGSPGLIISNLPYGKRVGAGMEIYEFYKRFGNHLRKACGGWKYGFVVADRDFDKVAGLRKERQTGFVNGGIGVSFVMGKILSLQ